MCSSNKEAHAGNVGIDEIISDLQKATTEQINEDPILDKYHQITQQFDCIKPLLFIHYDMALNTENTLAMELQDIHTCKTVSLACFTPNSNKKPLITETAPNCSLILGTNNPDGDCFVVYDSLEDGITLFMQNNMTDQKDDTIHVIFNKHIQTTKKLAENRKIKILTTADKKHDLFKSLVGANVEIYSTVQSVFIQLEEGFSLDMALEDAEVISMLETSIKFENGYINSLEDGLFYVTYNDEGEIKRNTKICDPLKVLARSRDANSTAWGLYIEWKDLDGVYHNYALSAHKLQGDSREYRKELAYRGLNIDTSPIARRALDAYLNNHPTTNRAICVNQIGWYKDTYVLPDVSFNKDNQLVVYQSDKPDDIIYNQQGTLEQWRDKLCKPLAEQSRIAFAISCAFTGQLLNLLNVESGGFHIVGGSSMGKSIGLKVAGSVWGDPDRFIKRWRATDNGLESVAATHNDSFLGLDEISEGDPKSIGNSAYMLANGQGKVRAKSSGGNRPTSTWRLVFLSNGEKSLNAYLNDAGIEVNAGQLVRLIHIEADANKGFRSFDSLVLADTAEEQAGIIRKLSTSYYGTAGLAWLEYLTKDKQKSTEIAKKLFNQFLGDFNYVKGQAYRVAERFAIVATAGEMATMASITGWETGQATEAVKSCFNNWLENYGTDGNHEERQIIERIQSFIEQHGSSRFQPWYEPNKDIHVPIIHNRVGWFNSNTNEYLFYPNSFKKLCGVNNFRKILKILDDASLIHSNEKRGTLKTKLPDLPNNKDRIRMYCVKGDILNYDVNQINGTNGTEGTPLTTQDLETLSL